MLHASGNLDLKIVVGRPLFIILIPKRQLTFHVKLETTFDVQFDYFPFFCYNLTSADAYLKSKKSKLITLNCSGVRRNASMLILAARLMFLRSVTMFFKTLVLGIP